jgi:hypothetical protein
MESAQTDQKLIPSLLGYKATDANMRCRGFQFELGVWYEVDGDLSLCHHGFHFCDHPSGPWAYYSEPGTRVFTCEAEDVLDLPVEPGADHKRVARRIRLVAEIIPDGNGNTGSWNTGDWNTGSWNTGDWNTGNGNTGNGNTGDWNTGSWNTGSWNTGDWNTGSWNTGDWNTGNGNTGDWNTGNGNTGDWNTGNGNTGDWNTGNGNTGNGNTTDYSTGFFCAKPQTVKCFDVDTTLTRDAFIDAYPLYYDLCLALTASDPIDFERFKSLPGITKAKLKALHEKHIAKRAK